MRMRFAVAGSVGIALALIAVAYSMRSSGAGEPPRAESPVDRVDAAQQTVGVVATSPHGERDEASTPPFTAPLAERPVSKPALRVRMLGLVDEAAWTTDVSLDIEGEDEAGREVSHSAELRPDAQGRMSFSLPDWAVMRMTKGRLRASDPAYTRLNERWYGGQDLGEEMFVDVRALASLSGRVVDEQGRPVKAQVMAETLSDAGELSDWVSTNTRVDGTWMRTAAASQRLQIVASATNGGDAQSLASARVLVQARAGASIEVPDIVLPRATFVTGSVRWIDGEPVDTAHLSLREVDGGRWGSDASGFTDAQGRFALPSAPGVAVSVDLAYAFGLVPQPESRRAATGQEVEFRLPRPVVLQARRGGEAITAWLEFGEGTIFVQYSHWGRRDMVVPTREIRVRARDGRWLSAWRTIGPADGGKTIDLELVATLTEVAIHLDSEVAVLSALSRWRRPDGSESREWLRRAKSDEPFRAFIEPGGYQVTIEAERFDDQPRRLGDPFLLPVECHAEVAGEQTTLRLPATFGGRLALAATDAAGTPTGARCVIAGSRASPAQTVELDPDRTTAWSGVLAPGTYDLHFELAGGVKRQRTVTIEARRLARVCVRL